MNERRLPLSWSVLDLQTAGDHALNDWLATSGSASTIRICLEDPDQHGLAAALIVLEGRLDLDDGSSVPLDQRLLVSGGVDVDGAEGASAARSLIIPRLPRGAATAYSEAKAEPGFGAAARLSRNGDAAVMLVGVASHPIRARQIESVVRGRTINDRIIDLAGQTARSEAQPYGVGDLTDASTVSAVEHAVRRLCRLLRDRLDEGEPRGRRPRTRRW